MKKKLQKIDGRRRVRGGAGTRRVDAADMLECSQKCWARAFHLAWKGKREESRSWMDDRMARTDDPEVIRYFETRKRKCQFANPGRKLGVASSIRSPSPSLLGCSNFRGTTRSTRSFVFVLPSRSLSSKRFLVRKIRESQNSPCFFGYTFVLHDCLEIL